MHYLFIFPFKHLVGSFLHAEGFLLLLLHQRFKKISLSFSHQFLSELCFMVFSSGPFGMAYFDHVLLHLKSFSSLSFSARVLLESTTSGWNNWLVVVYSLVYQLFDLCIRRAHPLPAIARNINDLFSICGVVHVWMGHSVVGWLISSSFWRFWSRGVCETSKQAFVFFEKLLILIDAMEYPFGVDVAFGFFDLRITINIIQFKNMVVFHFEFGFYFQVNDFRVIYANGALLRFLSNNFVNEVHGWWRQLDQRKRFIFINIRIHHKSFCKRAESWIACN